MGNVALVTDASIDLPPALAAELGVVVAPLGYELNGWRFTTAQQQPEHFYEGLGIDGAAQVDGVSADDFEAALREAMGHASQIVCVCQSVGSSFTRVSAEVAIRRVQRDGAEVRLISPGRSTAGLGAICLAVGRAIASGTSLDDAFALVEELSLKADTYAIPCDLQFLDHSGNLELMNSQSSIGPIDNGIPVFRVRGRISPVAVAPDHAAAEDELVGRVAAVAGDRAIVATVVHGAAAEAAERLAARVRDRLKVAELHTVLMGPTIGSVLGPGAYGLGFCVAP